MWTIVRFGVQAVLMSFATFFLINGGDETAQTCILLAVALSVFALDK